MRWMVALVTLCILATPVGAALTIRDGNAQHTIDLAEAFDFDEGALACRAMEVGPVPVLVLGVRDANEVRGAQKRWLIEQLSAREDQPVLVMYDGAAWPAVGNPSDRLSKAVREAWSRRLDEHGIRIVIEHEGYAIHKHTRPLLGERVDASAGVVYVDPGRPAGAGERVAPNPPGRWWRGGRWYLGESGRGAVDVTVRREGNRLAVTVNGEPMERERTAGVFAWSWLVFAGAIGVAGVIVAEVVRRLVRRRTWPRAG